MWNSLETIPYQHTASSSSMMLTKEKANIAVQYGNRPIPILPLLYGWILTNEQPTFFLRGQDTLTIGDQLRWKYAEIFDAYLSQSDPIAQLQAGKNLSSLPSLSALPRIHYRNASQVREFLAVHLEINAFLEVSWPVLVKYFGQEVELVLQVLHYPDEQAEPELVGWIQVYNDVETGMQQFDAFEEEWFLDHMHELNSRFNFNLEFK